MTAIETRGLNLPTDLGTVVLSVTTPTHMHVETHKDQPLSVNGVRTRLSLHLGLYDGVWSLARNDAGREEYHYMTAKKVDATDWRREEASDSARAKILKVVGEKVNQWVTTDAAKIFFAQLVLARAEQDRDAANGRIERLTKELKSEKDALPALEEKVVAARKIAQDRV
jgi:hypothetical protein